MREDYTRLMYQTAAAADLVTYGMGVGGYKRQCCFVSTIRTVTTRSDVTRCYRVEAMTCQLYNAEC